MQWPKIKATDPEVALEWVRNTDSTTLAVGHAVLYDIGLASTGYDNDGVGVLYVPANGMNPALFAGLVCNRAIVPNEYGWVQKYGLLNYGYLTGNQTAPFAGVLTAWDATSLTNLILRPHNGYLAASTRAGYLGVMAQVSLITTQAALEARPFWKGGYCIPMGFPGGGTTGITMATNVSSSCKVFINAFA